MPYLRHEPKPPRVTDIELADHIERKTRLIVSTMERTIILASAQLPAEQPVPRPFQTTKFYYPDEYRLNGDRLIAAWLQTYSLRASSIELYTKPVSVAHPQKALGAAVLQATALTIIAPHIHFPPDMPNDLPNGTRMQLYSDILDTSEAIYLAQLRQPSAPVVGGVLDGGSAVEVL